VSEPEAVAFTTEHPDSEEVRALIARLDAELDERYPREVIHALHPEGLTDLRLAFVVARVAGEAVACGALRLLGPGVGEVKRMYVLPAFRGRGLARQVLATLEGLARERGYSVLRLETGSRLAEAVGLYRSAGYEEIPVFGEYVGNPFSLCFEKRLT
jgi:putative acetyltransferase